MEQINLSEYGRNIIRYKGAPHKLDELNLELAGWYAFYSEQMIELELKEASFWEQNKDYTAEKPKSDALVRSLWKITTDGHKMIEYERVLRTIEKLMSTLRTTINRYNTEFKTQK